MIETSIETLIPIKEVPAHLEKITGKLPHIASIYRWIQIGIAGIRLDTLIIGGTRLTSTEALDRFFQESTKAKAKGKSLPKKRLTMWVLVSTMQDEDNMRVTRLNADNLDDAKWEACEIYKQRYPNEVDGIDCFDDIYDGLNPSEWFSVAEVQ